MFTHLKEGEMGEQGLGRSSRLYIVHYIACPLNDFLYRDNTHTNQSNQTNRSNQSRLFKPPPKDRPRVTRTESTKPLIMDLEEEEEEEDESPTAEQIPEYVT